MGHSVYNKVIIIGGINSIAFGNGFIAGQMAAVVSSLKKREEGIHLEDAQISFLASSVFLFSVFGMFLSAVVSDKIGRRWSFILFSIPSTISWIILYFAQNMLTFMMSRILAGVALGALFALKMCSTSEYTSPNDRGLFLNIASTFSPALAIGVAHALGIIMHWRNVALIGIIPSSIGVILPYFWIESPHWLASKGCFEECEVAFRKLHGNDSETELQLLINLEKAKYAKAKETQSIQTFRKLILAVKKQYFWDLMLLGVFMHMFITAAGKFAFNTMAITIIEEMTGSSAILLFTLIIDGFIVAGAIMSCILVRKLSMRDLLFRTGFVAIFILFSLSACMYFNSGSVLFQWLNVILLSLYFFVIKSGPYPILEALMGEIYPLEVKMYCFFISGVILMGSVSLGIMLLPYMVNVMGYSGMFFTNAILMSISLGYIWVRLPETKGRTLQEIEIYFKTKTFENVDQALSNEQIKALI